MATSRQGKLANSGYSTELKDRIKEAADEVGGLNQLADVAAFPRRSLGNWVAGRKPKPEALSKIAEVTGVSLKWLTTGKGGKFDSLFDSAVDRLIEARQTANLTDAEFEERFAAGLEMLRSDHAKAPQPQMVMLPLYDQRASAGAGALVASENASESLSVGRDWLRRNLPTWAPQNAVVGILEGSGDSMEPTIRDGDLLMVVQNVPWRVVERGGIFVFSLDDRVMLKRLQVLDNGDLRIISDNQFYEPMTVRMDDIRNRLIMHGYVFFHGGKPRGL